LGKIILFHQQYPFWFTYQAYIVVISYSLGCILHILCTGYVIMYWRFKLSLKADKREFANSNGRTNKAEVKTPKLINPKASISFNLAQQTVGNQKLIINQNKYYLHYEGLVFDEEINGLIGQQDELKQRLCIALVGKIIQTDLLDVTTN